MDELEKVYEMDRRVINDLMAKFREWAMMENVISPLKVRFEETVHLLGDSCMKEVQDVYERRKRELNAPTEDDAGSWDE
eukprot:gnl/Chilomastix_caulleri/1147.p1 GENE.gnl/Chilomastix_caulleri/1147~~gnl/Chilomastix_caulleri/1147.p1  ORF type:complete len:79 (+),score=16.89 gnl/Chilomastix_caulleri/1147:94-330(+)